MRGTIKLFTITEGKWSYHSTFTNNTLNSGYDIMARAVAGDTTAIVNGMYVEYMNGTPLEPVIELDRTPEYYRNLSAPYGYVRFKTISQPVFSTSDDALYTNNVVTFRGVTDGDTSQGGAPILDGTSQFFTIALAALPVMNDDTADTLISAAPIKNAEVFAPITKIANSNLGFEWSLKMGD